MKYIVLLGRILFSLIFLNAIFAHFSAAGIEYASASGVPFPSILVPISGVIAILGGISIVLGYKTRIGAWLIVIFLIPVTFMMHNFWAIQDAAEAQMQMGNFIKNLSLMGGAFIISYFGAGPLSIDNRMKSSAGMMAEPERRAKFQPKFSREYDYEKPERTKSQAQKEKEKAGK